MSALGRLSPAVVVFLVILSSCAPKRAEISLDTSKVSAATLISLVQTNEQKVRSIVGKGVVSFESEQLAGSASFELSMKKPDSLLVIFEGPFGIDLGTLFLSRGKYVMYNSMENRVITGVPSARTIRSVIPFDLTYEQILSVFSGDFPISSDTETMVSYSVVDDQFRLSFSCGKTMCTYWVDPAYLRVSRYEMRDSLQHILVEAHSSSFTERDNVSAPKRISITFPQDGRQVSLSYSSMKLNEREPSFVFSIPQNAHTIVR
jgi:outer membrane lipoprotein-sorting protein